MKNFIMNEELKNMKFDIFLQNKKQYLLELFAPFRFFNHSYFIINENNSVMNVKKRNECDQVLILIQCLLGFSTLSTFIQINLKT